MMNPTFTLAGRITEPKIHNFEGEYCAISFSLATTVNEKNREGNFEEETIWYPCKIITKKTDGRIPYLKKGVFLFLSVSYKPETWTEGEQKKSKPMFIVKEFQLGPKLAPAEGGSSAANANKPATSEASTSTVQKETPKQEKVPEIDVDEDEIPF